MLSEVIINNIHVDLSADFSITVEKNSRLAQFDEIVDSWAYNINFPRTETNERAFEHAERFQKKWGGWQEFSFIFYYNGRLILLGKIKLKYKSGKYEGYAYGTFGAIASAQGDKLVKNVLAPGLIPFENKAEYPVTDPYCLFPVINTSFYETRGIKAEAENSNGEPVEIETRNQQFITTHYGYQNHFDESTDLFIEADGTDENLAVITPFLFCSYLYKKLFDSLDVVVVENILATDTLLQRACFYTSYDITKVDLVQVIIIEIGEIDLGDVTYNGSREISETNYYRNVPGNFEPVDLLPEEWTVKDYLLGIQNMLNIIFDFSATKNEVRIRDREAIFSGAAKNINDKLAEAPDLEPVDAKKVIIDFEKDSNDGIWNDYYQEIDDEKWGMYQGEVASKTVLDSLTGMDIGEFYYVLDENQYREYRTEEVTEIVSEQEQTTEDTDWYPLSIYGHPLIIGEGDEELKIESKFGVVAGWPNHRGHLQLTGNSDMFTDERKGFIPRIMFYQGLVSGVPRGDALGGLVDMTWLGDNSLYKKRWQNTLKAIQEGVPGVAYFNFDEVDIQALDLNQKFRIDEGEFIIEKCTTTFYANHMDTTEAAIMKLA